MRTLHLLRHAKASRDGADDRDRPLAARGVRAATVVGVYLAQEGLVPDLVLCSSARRAVETWEAVAAQLPRPPRVRREDSLYLAPPGELLARVREAPGAAHSVLVVGHNPGLFELAASLAAGDADAVRRLGKFPTGALASFALEHGGWGELGPGRVTLAGFVAPADLV